MNNNSTATEMFALYELLGEEAFTALIALSDMSNARIVQMTAEVTNLSPVRNEQALTIHAAVARKGRQQVKNDLLNIGISEEDVETAFRVAGV